MHEGSANHVGQGAAQNNATGIAQNFADQFFLQIGTHKNLK